MKQLQQIVFKILPISLGLISLLVQGQKQTKTYNETFKVDQDAVLDINTSYADIEFETWDKNEVQIQGVLEIEGISIEEAEKYFKNNGLKIVGNSKTIEISTQGENSWTTSYSFSGMEDFHIEIPEMPEMDFLLEIPPVPELPNFPAMAPMPPMPPVAMNGFNFDYEAYEKDGEKYLKQWKKEFDKTFNEDFKVQMEEWSEEMKARTEEMKSHHKEMSEERKMALEARKEAMKDRQEAMVERQKEMQKQQKEKIEKRIVVKSKSDSNSDAPNVFYWSSDGKESNLKVKKTIKVKMPKSTKLKLNVRHGEVKLAEHTKNMKATLSYARLLAYTIDGDMTNIITSYSPITVMNWNYGQLKADYSEHVDLRKVRNIILNTTSSEVTIDQLLKSIIAQNDFGALRVNSIAKDFTSIDISIQNGELNCGLPESPFQVSYTGVASEFNTPSKLKLTKTQNGRTTTYKGGYLKAADSPMITLNAKYSEVNLQ